MALRPSSTGDHQADHVSIQINHREAPAVVRLDDGIGLEKSRNAGSAFAQLASHRILEITATAAAEQVGSPLSECDHQFDGLARTLQLNLDLVADSIRLQRVNQCFRVDNLVAFDLHDGVFGVDAGLFGSALFFVMAPMVARVVPASSWTPRNPLSARGTRPRYGGEMLRGPAPTTPTVAGSAPTPATAIQFPAGGVRAQSQGHRHQSGTVHFQHDQVKSIAGDGPYRVEVTSIVCLDRQPARLEFAGLGDNVTVRDDRAQGRVFAVDLDADRTTARGLHNRFEQRDERRVVMNWIWNSGLAPVLGENGACQDHHEQGGW